MREFTRDFFTIFGAQLKPAGDDELVVSRLPPNLAQHFGKDELHLVIPQRFYVHQQARQGDRHLYAARTRFIPREIVHHFDIRSWPAARPSLGGRKPLLPAVDLRERLRGTWHRTAG